MHRTYSELLPHLLTNLAVGGAPVSLRPNLHWADPPCDLARLRTEGESGALTIGWIDIEQRSAATEALLLDGGGLGGGVTAELKRLALAASAPTEPSTSSHCAHHHPAFLHRGGRRSGKMPSRL
jgi:hypothetical protein